MLKKREIYDLHVCLLYKIREIYDLHVCLLYKIRDFLMAEFKFMQVKTTFDDKLELINAALPLLNCSLLFETFSTRGS